MAKFAMLMWSVKAKYKFDFPSVPHEPREQITHLETIKKTKNKWDETFLKKERGHVDGLPAEGIRLRTAVRGEMRAKTRECDLLGFEWSAPKVGVR